MAESIVSVRKVGSPAPGAGAAAAAPRGDRRRAVQEALDRGAIPDAVKAFDALPAASRDAAAEFGKRLKARAAAGDAARSLLASTFGGLTGAPTR